MGIYLNPGNDIFQKALRSQIYVDKTAMITYTNQILGTEQGNICVSRPRRFGKSMTAGMLAAYYSRGCDSEKLFSNLKISESNDFRKYLNQYDVIFLNVQQFMRKAGTAENLVPYLENKVLSEIKTVYSECVANDETSLPDALTIAYMNDTHLNKGFIFILDEWDCIFRESADNTKAQKAWLDFLRDLFKDRIYVQMAYMTGILPIKKYGTHSALNIFGEFSMINPKGLAEFVGFTETEVRDLCSGFDMDFEEAQKWYDGYRFKKASHIYNPKSIVDAMLEGEYKNYWTSTETYEALQIYIDLDMDGLKESIITMIGGGSCPVDTEAFQNDMTTFRSKDDVLTLLVHLGYLAYDEQKEAVFIPNEEVREEFLRAVRNGNRPELIRAIQKSDALLDATLRMDCDEVALLIEEVHSANTSPDFYNNEQALRSVIKLAYYSCKDDYFTIQELPSGIGYADIVFLPRKNCNKPAMLVELKWNKTSEGAISQIKNKKYVKTFENYGGDILLVGINYDAKSKKHQCSIELYKSVEHIEDR